MASAAPVSMLVEPGPIDAVQAKVGQPVAHPGVADRGVHHALLVAGLVVGQRARVEQLAPRSSAWPTPATLPCPKMPKQPANSALLDAVALGALGGQEPHDAPARR